MLPSKKEEALRGAYPPRPPRYVLLPLPPLLLLLPRPRLRQYRQISPDPRPHFSLPRPLSPETRRGRVLPELQAAPAPPSCSPGLPRLAAAQRWISSAFSSPALQSRSPRCCRSDSTASPFGAGGGVGGEAEGFLVIFPAFCSAWRSPKHRLRTAPKGASLPAAPRLRGGSCRRGGKRRGGGGGGWDGGGNREQGRAVSIVGVVLWWLQGRLFGLASSTGPRGSGKATACTCAKKGHSSYTWRHFTPRRFTPRFFHQEKNMISTNKV